MKKNFFLEICDKRNYLSNNCSRVFDFIRFLTVIVPLFYSCSYYTTTKQGQIETTAFDIDKNVKTNYPNLSVPAGYEIISIDNKPILWTSKNAIISLSPGVHIIESKLDMDSKTTKRVKVSSGDHGYYSQNKWDTYLETTTIIPHGFKRHGTVTYNFKKKCSYYISYGDGFKICKQTGSNGSHIVSFLGLVGIIILLTWPYW
jgi:hypothetical protein